MRIVQVLLLCGFYALPAVGQQTQPTGSPTKALDSVQPGELVRAVQCSQKPDQSYALYLPTNYSTKEKWPIVYAFDPGASGARPVTLMKEAAERYGFILAGSNNSHNGAIEIQQQAAAAMVEDTHARFSLDDRLIFFAGFSGGARFVTSLAARCKCAVAVALNGAGFWAEQTPGSKPPFAVFSAAGMDDFNFGEVVTVDKKLEQLNASHWLRQFEGTHQWAPSEVWDETLAWFRVAAMKSGNLPKDETFIRAFADRALQLARTMQQAGELHAAWQEFRQGAQLFDGLVDTTAWREQATILQSDKEVQREAKRETQEFAEQERLSAFILGTMDALPENFVNHAEILQQLKQQIHDLRERAAHEKHPESAHVLRRAVGNILVAAMELGGARLDSKNVSQAAEYFALASEADPDSPWALNNLAVASALQGKRQETFNALRKSKANARDAADFISWIAREDAFAKYRDTPEFRDLLDPHK